MIEINISEKKYTGQQDKNEYVAEFTVSASSFDFNYAMNSLGIRRCFETNVTTDPLARDEVKKMAESLKSKLELPKIQSRINQLYKEKIKINKKIAKFIDELE